MGNRFLQCFPTSTNPGRGVSALFSVCFFAPSVSTPHIPRSVPSAPLPHERILRDPAAAGLEEFSPPVLSLLSEGKPLSAHGGSCQLLTDGARLGPGADATPHPAQLSCSACGREEPRSQPPPGHWGSWIHLWETGLREPGTVGPPSLGSGAVLTWPREAPRSVRALRERRRGRGARTQRIQKAAPRVRWEGSRADRAQRARPRETEGARRAALRVRARKTAARHRESLAGSEEPERRGDSRRRGGELPGEALTSLPPHSHPHSCAIDELPSSCSVPRRRSRRRRRSRSLQRSPRGVTAVPPRCPPVRAERWAVPCRLQGRLGSDEGRRGSAELPAFLRAAPCSSVWRQHAPSLRDPGTVCNCETSSSPAGTRAVTSGEAAPSAETALKREGPVPPPIPFSPQPPAARVLAAAA